MKRVIFHWTAGAHTAGETDLAAYHILVEGNGRLVRGNASIALNSGRVKKGYAAHTLNANGGAIGVSMCCMGGAVPEPLDPGRFPMTETQWNRMAEVIAELCAFYRIPVTPKTVLSHAEVEPNLGIRQLGKWDVSRLPFDPACRGARACGDRMRAQVNAAMAGMPQLPVRKGKDPSPLQALFDEIVPILVRGLQAGLNTLIREIVKRIT